MVEVSNLRAGEGFEALERANLGFGEGYWVNGRVRAREWVSECGIGV